MAKITFEKIPREYDAVAFERLFKQVVQQLETLQEATKVREARSTEANAASAAAEKQWNFVLDDSQNATATIRLRGRLYIVSLTQA